MGMFDETQTLIVVSKDEMLINQFKKLVETNAEKFSSVKIVAWNEKTWITNKKAGNIDTKVLFIGDVKGTDKLIPVIDEKYNSYGVKYGWAGKQAVIYIDIKEINEQKKYNLFFEELEKLPVPAMIKKRVSPAKEFEKIEKVENNSIEENMNNTILIEEDGEDTNIESVDIEVIEEKKPKFNVFKKIGDIAKDGATLAGNVFENAKDGATNTAQELFKDRGLLKKQMLFFGVIKMCDEGLDTFLKS